MVLAWFGCGGTLPDETTPRSPTEPTEPTEVEDTGTTPPPEETDLYLPPTNVDAPCWSWAAGFLRLNLNGADDDLIYTRLRTYDPATLSLLSMSYDRDADGHVDQVLSYAWDAAFANVLQEREDADADGIDDEIVEWAYDSYGLRTALRIDEDGDGAWEEVWTYTYAGDLRTTAEQDLADDGTVDAVGTYTYDESNRVTEYALDEGLDGTVDLLLNYTYDDAEGPSTTRVTDVGADGVSEETMTWVYDDLSRIVQTHFSSSEGSEAIYDYTYNDDSDVATLGAVIVNSAGYSRFATVYTYEAPRRLSHESTEFYSNDDTGDPTLLSHIDYTWFCPVYR